MSMVAARAFFSFAFSALLALPAAAQTPAKRIYTIPFGTPVTELPADYAMQACGTNGGPPRTFLDSFAEFKNCPVEAATGLREIWYSEDDTAEYFMRALRVDEDRIEGFRANTLFEHQVIYSVLVDEQGLVQGYRIVTDPREDIRHRREANVVAPPLKNVVFGAFGWTCTDLPKEDGERPFKGEYTKEICRKETNGRKVSIETHVLLKPGQQETRIGEGLRVGEFDVQVRLEVINAALAR